MNTRTLAVVALLSTPFAVALAAPPQKPAASAAASNLPPRLQSLAAQLNLDDATAQRVAAALEADHDNERAAHEQVRHAKADLKALLEMNSTDDARYATALTALNEGKQKLAALKEARFQRLAAVLKPHQVARLWQMKEHHKKGRRGGRDE
jgi:Spy/CpxP family protein refolding chaperone